MQKHSFYYGGDKGAKILLCLFFFWSKYIAIFILVTAEEQAFTTSPQPMPCNVLSHLEMIQQQ